MKALDAGGRRSKPDATDPGRCPRAIRCGSSRTSSRLMFQAARQPGGAADDLVKENIRRFAPVFHYSMLWTKRGF